MTEELMIAIEKVEKGEAKVKRTEQELLRLEKKLKAAMDRKKNLINLKNELNRKARTRRLIERGAMLEGFLPHPEFFENEEVYALLKIIFNQEETEKLINQISSDMEKSLVDVDD